MDKPSPKGIPMMKLPLIFSLFLSSSLYANKDHKHSQHHKLNMQHKHHTLNLNVNFRKPMYVTSMMENHHKSMMREHLETIQKVTESLSQSDLKKSPNTCKYPRLFKKKKPANIVTWGPQGVCCNLFASCHMI